MDVVLLLLTRCSCARAQGRTSFEGDASDVLNEVRLNVVDEAECDAVYGGGITDSMMCASLPGKDSCQGDSGGPMIVKGVDASADVQVGIVSWGTGCADADHPGVYARVSHQLDWIETQIASGDKPALLRLWGRLMVYLGYWGVGGGRDGDGA